jgi:hypothetical protein
VLFDFIREQSPIRTEVISVRYKSREENVCFFVCLCALVAVNTEPIST